MKHFHICLFALIVLIGTLFAGNAFAQANKSGVDFKFGLAVPMYVSAGVGEVDEGLGAKAFEGIGAGLDVQMGYRWKYFGILLEQQMYGQWAKHDMIDKSIYDAAVAENPKALRLDGRFGFDSEYKKNDALWLCASMLLLREYIPIGEYFLISIGEGAGVMYGSEKLMNADWLLAVKGEIGIAYFIKKWLGIGVNMYFVAGLGFDDGIDFSYIMTPSLTFNIVI